MCLDQDGNTNDYGIVYRYHDSQHLVVDSNVLDDLQWKRDHQNLECLDLRFYRAQCRSLVRNEDVLLRL